MQFYLTGDMSKQDKWVLNYIEKEGPVSCCDEPVITEYARTFNKPTIPCKHTGNLRCKPLEKKITSLWRRGYLVRVQQVCPYSDKPEVWYYGLPGRDEGELFTPALGGEQ